MEEKIKDESTPRAEPGVSDGGEPPVWPEDEITHRHMPFSAIDANAQLTMAVARSLEGDLAAIARAIEALPPSHPRRRLLLSNLMRAVTLLQDLPGILAR